MSKARAFKKHRVGTTFWGGGYHPGLPCPRRYRLPSISVDRRKTLPTFWACAPGFWFAFRSLSAQLPFASRPQAWPFAASCARTPSASVSRTFHGARPYIVIKRLFISVRRSHRLRPWDHRPETSPETARDISRRSVRNFYCPSSPGCPEYWTFVRYCYGPLVPWPQRIERCMLSGYSPPTTVTVGRFNFTTDEINGRFQWRLLEGGLREPCLPQDI